MISRPNDNFAQRPPLCVSTHEDGVTVIDLAPGDIDLIRTVYKNGLSVKEGVELLLAGRESWRQNHAAEQRIAIEARDEATALLNKVIVIENALRIELTEVDRLSCELDCVNAELTALRAAHDQATAEIEWMRSARPCVTH